MLPQQITTHCEKCNDGKIKITIKAHTKYRCNTCKLVVSSKIKQCTNHSGSGSYSTFHQQNDYIRSCRVCSGKGSLEKPVDQGKESRESKAISDKELNQNTSGITKAFDSLQRTIKFDRKLMQAVKQFNNEDRSHPFSLIKAVVNHIEKYKPKEAISEFRQAFMPEEMVAKIADETDCDKWAEKTKLGNLVMWTLTFFLQNKTEDLAIQEIANASASLLGRELSDDGSAVDHNSVGVRLEKPQLIQALEMMLQLCSAQLESNAFEENGSLVNIYYDWFFLVKSGKVWKACQEVGRTKESNAIKIGIGIEWDSKAVVSLVMHGEHHRNDVVSFREKLMVTQRPGLVHISDLGPFFTKTMKEIRDNQQHFIIKLKKNIGYQQVHQIFYGRYEFELDTPSQTKIIVLEEKLIRLNANLELGEVKYIRFQYHCFRTGKFKTIELISSLPLSAEQIIQAHAWRWVATETEFNILQHQFGLEKLYIKKPEKAWPLLLLVLCGKMLMEFTFRAIHSLHGSTTINNIIGPQKMQTASFRRGFANFLTAVLTGIENPLELIEPCQDPYCCFRSNHGQRLS